MEDREITKALQKEKWSKTNDVRATIEEANIFERQGIDITMNVTEVEDLLDQEMVITENQVAIKTIVTNNRRYRWKHKRQWSSGEVESINVEQLND